MNRSCTVCNKRESDSEPLGGYSFHGIPKANLDVRKEWFVALKNYISESVKLKDKFNIYVCSEHFHDDDFNVGRTGKRVLCRDAVPSILSSKERRVNEDDLKKSMDPLQLSLTERTASVRAGTKHIPETDKLLMINGSTKLIGLLPSTLNLQGLNNNDNVVFADEVKQEHLEPPVFDDLSVNIASIPDNSVHEQHIFVENFENNAIVNQARVSSTISSPTSSTTWTSPNSPANLEACNEDNQVGENPMFASPTSPTTWTNPHSPVSMNAWNEELAKMSTRKLREPRYINEIEVIDVRTPQRARRVLAMVKRYVDEQRKKIRSLQKNNLRLTNRLYSLKQTVNITKPTTKSPNQKMKKFIMYRHNAEMVTYTQDSRVQIHFQRELGNKKTEFQMEQ